MLRIGIGGGPATKLNGRSRTSHCASVLRARRERVRDHTSTTSRVREHRPARSLLARVDVIHGGALGAETPVPILTRIHWRLGRVPASRLDRRTRQQ
jgi:hypothetical protein